MRFLLTTFLAKTCFVIVCTLIGMTFIFFSNIYGQNEPRADQLDPSAITISMKRDGFPCGYVPVNEKDLNG